MMFQVRDVVAHDVLQGRRFARRQRHPNRVEAVFPARPLANIGRRAFHDAKAPLTQLVSQLNAAAGSSSDAEKVKMLASTVADLAGAQ